MKFSSKENLEIPIEQAFAILTDFERYERRALRRGAQVKQKDSLSEPGVGSMWDVVFNFRGKDRAIELTLVSFERPEEMRFDAKMQGLNCVVAVELVPLSRTRTRMIVSSELTPNSLSARLLVQSLRLARGNLNKRFGSRLSAHARELEDHYSRIA